MPENINKAIDPIKVNAIEMNRIAFQGVKYKIESGQAIGSYYWGESDDTKKKLAWVDQNNPQQFNKLIEKLFSNQGYPVYRYGNRNQPYSKSSGSDTKVSLIINTIDSQERKSDSYTNRYHKIELLGVIEAYSENSSDVYRKDIQVNSIDYAESEYDQVDALPEAIKKAITHLLADENFVDFAKKRKL
jgi:hypothetical protein